MHPLLLTYLIGIPAVFVLITIGSTLTAGPFEEQDIPESIKASFLWPFMTLHALVLGLMYLVGKVLIFIDGPAK